MADDSDIKEARETFASAESAETHNRKTYREDTSFARGGDQWPAKIREMREKEGKPVLTINKMTAFIRQVVNDARQNKPSIKVHPVDSGADPETAEVINGIIRNIETTSNADMAYDTATECAVSGGWGYIRVIDDYSYEDSFEKDLCIKRIANPLSVYGDPNSTEADSSDWDDAFIVDQLSEVQFKQQYPGADHKDFTSSEWAEVGESWRKTDDKTVTVAEYWKRREVDKKVLQLSNGMIVKEEDVQKSADLQGLLQSGMVTVSRERMAKCHKVTQHIMSGTEILKTTDWLGKYIPIIPVYGDEFDIEGRRYWRSLIHSAIDAQRMVNYWRSTSVELLALAPRVPFIGPQGAFTDERWLTINTQNHPYVEFDASVYAKTGLKPERQPLDTGAAAGALLEAASASDDMKAIIGLYDASLGAKSNETSGRAILARQREGDVSTFHFIDNMARAIRHTGRILLDLIPHYYSTERMVRIIGEDGTQEAKPINQQYNPIDPKTGEPVMEPAVDPNTGQPIQDEAGNPVMKAAIAMHDLRTGKYDLTVTTGPSFSTRREEAALQMTELIRALPDSAPIIAPELAKNLDWPGADKIAEKFEALEQNQVPPEVQKQIDEGAQQIEQLTQENQQLKMDQSAEMAKLEAQKVADQAKVESQKQIEFIKIKANEDIEMAKIASEERIALAKAQIQARASIVVAANKPQPQGNSNGQSR